MIRTILVWIGVPAYLIYSIFIPLPIVLIMSKVKSEKEANDFAKEIARIWGRFFLWLSGSKVEVIYKDREAFDAIKDQPVVLVANHQSNMDIPLVLGYFPIPVGFVAKKEMKTWPIMGLWMKKIGCVFLDRKNPREGIKSIKEAAENIRKGYSVVIFPEGTRSADGEIGEFKKGSFKLAIDTNVNIIPITIEGTIDVHRKGTFMVNKNPNVKIIVDKPIDISTFERAEKKELSEKVRKIIVDNYRK